MLSKRAVAAVDPRALDLLVMPVAGENGIRTVGKQGVRIDGAHYLAAHVMPGTMVFVRQDPLDLGRALLFELNGGRFLCEAICPALSGLDPQAVVAAAKIEQRELIADATREIKRDMKRLARGPALIDRVLDVAKRDAPNLLPFPRRQDTRTTPAIEAAIEAMAPRTSIDEPTDPRTAAAQARLLAEIERAQEAKLEEQTDELVTARLDALHAERIARLNGGATPMPETERDRYRRAVECRLALDAGTLDAALAVWLGRYESSAEFRAQKRIHDDFGDAWLTG